RRLACARSAADAVVAGPVRAGIRPDARERGRQAAGRGRAAGPRGAAPRARHPAARTRGARALRRGVGAGAGALRRRPERGRARGRHADPVGDGRARLPDGGLRPACRRRLRLPPGGRRELPGGPPPHPRRRARRRHDGRPAPGDAALSRALRRPARGRRRRAGEPRRCLRGRRRRPPIARGYVRDPGRDGRPGSAPENRADSEKPSNRGWRPVFAHLGSETGRFLSHQAQETRLDGKIRIQNEAQQLEAQWRYDPRWHGVARTYTGADVARLRGSVRQEHTLARLGAERRWSLLRADAAVRALGALTGGQAVQMVRAGLEAIYLSGWQVAADANLAASTYPDQSLYPANSVPALVRRLNNALLRADQIDWAESRNGT